MEQEIPEVMPVNRKSKDTFFKTVYAAEERRRALVAFLLGVEGKKISIANVRPVFFGNKENDLAFECDDVFYVMAENQSSVSPNVPYRLLEYVMQACARQWTVSGCYMEAGECIFQYQRCICCRPDLR